MCLFYVQDSSVQPCWTYGRQKLTPCIEETDEDLAAVLAADAFRLRDGHNDEVGTLQNIFRDRPLWGGGGGVGHKTRESWVQNFLSPLKAG